MNAPKLSVTTPHGTFLRNTWNAYAVIAVVQMEHNNGPWAIWSRDLDKARKNVQRLANGRCFGFYAVADGHRVAPGLVVSTEPHWRRAAPKPEVVHEFERCEQCDRRHDPARLQCGNCWRCHEPSIPCKITQKEIEASRERHANQPDFYRVLTQAWRPFNEVTAPQCGCH